ncbi:hypothetical protein FRC04_002334 [Tulasnella sp. 424]|nr:hypothetical protein FRC04_002334 [Tulasnella sp. 424]KAG8977407.1 hypothetical protein FRC05_001805 [Tulasnella sp. 425]
MVSFQCDGCGDVVKKPKLDSHGCGSSFTCLDCNKTFHTPADWKPHTTCITEDQKYQKSVYKPKQERQQNSSSQNGGWNQFDADPNAAPNPSPNTNGQIPNGRPSYGSPNGYNRNRGPNNRQYGNRPPPPPRNQSTGVNSIPMRTTRVWGSNAPSPSPSSPPAEEQTGDKRKLDNAETQSDSARESKRTKHSEKSEVEQTSNADSTVVDSASDSKKSKKDKKDKKKERKEKKSSDDHLTGKPDTDAMDIDTAVEDLPESRSKKEKKEKKDKKRKDKSEDAAIADNADELSSKMVEKRAKKEKRKEKEIAETTIPDEPAGMDGADVEPKKSKKSKENRDSGEKELKKEKKEKKEKEKKEKERKKEKKERKERKESAAVEA